MQVHTVQLITVSVLKQMPALQLQFYIITNLLSWLYAVAIKYYAVIINLKIK
jgi:hypothetical protein